MKVKLSVMILEISNILFVVESAVFCCNFDPSGSRLISGGEDDVANIWDDSSIKSQSPICICRGHKVCSEIYIICIKAIFI